MNTKLEKIHRTMFVLINVKKLKKTCLKFLAIYNFFVNLYAYYP